MCAHMCLYVCVCTCVSYVYVCDVIHRMEGFLAMSILCTTSELSLEVLNLVQSLASTSSHSPKTIQDENVTKTQTTSQSLPTASKEKSKLRFIMPHSMKLGGRVQIPVEQDSSIRKMPTLNMLGMQPDFNLPDGESTYTEARTEPSLPATREWDINVDDYRRLVSTKTASADYVRHMHMHGTQNTFMRITHSYTPDTVRTQSLIENESIPDPLPSALNSNISIMDVTGSFVTVDLGESMGKSAGQLLTSSNSKNMDISVSNLVSPCVLPSGDLESIDEGTMQSFASGAKVKEIRHDNSNSAINQSKNQRIHYQDSNSLKEPNTELIKSNEAKISLVEKPQERNLYSRCTHYTHSTAPLAGGANMLGSMVHPSTVIRQSGLYSTQSGLPLVKEEPQPLPLCSWPNEVVLAYVHGMACCAIYGRTTIIQKTAMQGLGQKSEAPRKKCSSHGSNKKVRECGLMNLVGFKNSTEVNNSKCLFGIRYMLL